MFSTYRELFFFIDKPRTAAINATAAIKKSSQENRRKRRNAAAEEDARKRRLFENGVVS